MRGYNTADAVVRDSRTKQVTKYVDCNKGKTVAASKIQHGPKRHAEQFCKPR